ncbi:hypothetical protein E4O03_11190 [Treponema sp. OMZ 792]|uniref:hypothetical protein n=1 Tax=unclassified Treponema TaxID=2638727 RepID=UPI0020A6163C|nr:MULTISPECIES: hypothetical protein [unclassified Treponema]UTC74748.1 hypothetical protein E4O03_11190 [Treponema sp. OMZ 792]UTC81142.1 hypothetical protein E4O07_11090 [Treponema sp. OMZ 798]
MKEKFLLDIMTDKSLSLVKFLKNTDPKEPNKVNEDMSRLIAKFNKILKGDGENFQISSADIEKEWFPEIRADIFISHSHNDLEIARALKNLIETTFDLECFIDADVWEHYRILADIITKYDDCGCFNDNIIKSSAILNVALFKMINRCKALFFIKSKNSTINNNHQTLSPWIYSEISISNIMHSKIMESAERYDESVKVLFDTDFSNFRNLTFSDLETWLDTCKGKNIKGRKALDKLLDIVKNKRGGFIKNP